MRVAPAPAPRRPGVPLAHKMDAKTKSRRHLVVVIVWLALVCTAILLLNDHRIHSRSAKQVRIKYSASTSRTVSVKERFRGSVNNQQLIPQVLHHVYLDGLDSLHKAEQSLGPQVGEKFPSYNRTMRRSCPRVHHKWQYLFWNHSQAEDLIQASYPWFLDTFRSYETSVQRGPLLSGREIVLQLENEDTKSLNNAVMASIPGHPFWMVVIERMMAERSYTAGGFMGLGFKDASTILHSTGPYLMRDAFVTYTREAGDLRLGWAGEWDIDDSRFQVYPVGQWFEPCIWDDYQCHQQVQAAQQLPPSLVGHHINSGAWLKDLKTYNRKLFWRWLAAAATVITACFCCAALVLRWRQHCNHCPSA